jgi:hypothetical protein
MKRLTREYAIVFDGDNKNIVLTDGLEAYVAAYFSELIDDNNARLVSFDRVEMTAVYSYEPSLCLGCDADEADNGEDICTKHQQTVELDWESVDVWTAVS